MTAVYCQDVVFLGDHRVALVKFVQSGFVQRVVHDTAEPLAVTLSDLHPKVLALSS